MVNGWPVSLIFLLTGKHRVDNLSNTRRKIETLTSGNVYPTTIINLFSLKSHNIIFGQFRHFRNYYYNYNSYTKIMCASQS